MGKLNRRMPTVDPSHFAMVPRSDIPRSTFRTDHTYKTTFNVDVLVPVHVDEVLPGDVHNGDMTVFARLATPIWPIMDNLTLESFFFFVPCRLIWSNWKKFMGEQVNPGDSISYTIPQIPSPAGGWPVASMADYMGLPTAPSLGANTVSVSALPSRAYLLIWDEWFRDENLQNSQPVPTGDGPDAASQMSGVYRRNKKHDYFTSCLPWPLKGGVEVPLPLGGVLAVKTQATALFTGAQAALQLLRVGGAAPVAGVLAQTGGAGAQLQETGGAATSPVGSLYPSNLVVDLGTATGATVNSMRMAVATQQFLERDARGGTRYTEILRARFGVFPEDSRLQRPEYIGGGCSRIQTSAIPQTSAQIAAGPTVGTLGAAATVADRHHFKYHATEHGYIIGLVQVTGDVTYQRGVHRMWSRTTRYDFYDPIFQNLGEQAVLNREIYSQGLAADTAVFGYQERWAEYRYRPSRITGLFRSTATGNIDDWHLSEEFLALPTLSASFIGANTPFARVAAAGINAANQQILFDSVFGISCTRAMPQYSVPGLRRF